MLIALPLYRHPELATRVIGSLITCADDIRSLQGEVVIYDDSPDDAALTQALDAILDQATAAFRCRLERNPLNLGFVGTTNQALEEAAERGMDALLLNSDTVIFPGALPEMVRVSRLDPMIGFVNPRSNNATLATLPYQDRFRRLEPAPARQAWAEVSGRLPEMSYVPTAIGFCMLIRWAILSEFGGFDEIYGRGYNEENDLVMRAGRRGYRAVLANHAFVWHEGAASFGLGDEAQAREIANRTVLAKRYPEYDALVEGYFASPEQRAEYVLGALIPDETGRVEVAFDFSSFVPAHNGTFAAGAQLLGAAVLAWRDRFKIYVMCAEDTYVFHDYGRFGVERRDPHDPRPVAAMFRVGQPFEWGAIQRLVINAAVFGVFMLDTISLDCTQLTSHQLRNVWAYTLEHADFIAATSELTAGQLERRFSYGPDTLRVRSLHSLDLDDYKPAEAASAELAPAAPGYVFVVGNHYWHKDVAKAANALASAYPDRTIVVLTGESEAVAGGAPPRCDEGRYAPRGLDPAPNLVRAPAGRLSDVEVSALYANAGAVVIPSHYEGFGIPVLNALAARRPVFVRPLPVFEEMSRALGGEANLHVFSTTAELVAMLSEPPPWDPQGASRGRPGDAARTAHDIGQAIDAALARADFARIVRRIRAIQSAHDVAAMLIAAQPPHAPATPRAFVAELVGRIAERWTARLLAIPGLFPVVRTGARWVRAPVRAWRRATR